MGRGRRILRGFLSVVHVIVLVLLAVWTVGALYYVVGPWDWLRVALAVLFAVGVIALLSWPPTRRAVPWVVVTAFLVSLAVFLSLQPSNDRAWTAAESQTPWGKVEGDVLTLHNVRNFRYRDGNDADAQWETRTYDLSRLEAVWFLLARFPDLAIAAHTFVSFEFEDGECLAVSIEARKEVGEAYGILPGLYRRFETIYVAADERDVVGLRTHVRGDEVYLYPMRSTPDGRRAFLLDMVRRMNELRLEPAFYNTLFDTCTTGLYEHLNRVREEPVPLTYEILVSGLSDRRAHELGLIDTDLPYEAARARYRIDPAVASPDDPAFSLRIRGR